MKCIIHTKYCILHFLSTILILLLLTPLVYNYIPVQKGKTTFYLPSSDIDSVIDTLKENGYGVSKIDKMMLQFFKAPEKGWYSVKKTPKQRFTFFEILSSQKAKTMRVKLYAGETSIELTKRLAYDLKLNEKKLLEEYRKLSKYLEGDILSGYYKVARKADEHAIITALYQMSQEKFKSFTLLNCSAIESNELELKVLLILASIIQKETYHTSEMPIIASVIENRLNKGMKLQMDGTLSYGEYAHQPITSKRIRKDKSYYNTYIHGGIPPTPLCTVSIKALDAVLYPEKTDYLYFMLNKEGKHDFSVSYKEHTENIKAFKSNKHEKDSNTSIKPKPKPSV